MWRALLLLLAGLVLAASALLLLLHGGRVEPAPSAAEAAGADATPNTAPAPLAMPEAGAARPERAQSAADEPVEGLAAARDAARPATRIVTMRLVDENAQPVAGATGGVLLVDEEDRAGIIDVLRLVEGQAVDGGRPYEATVGAGGVARIAVPFDEERLLVVYGRAAGREIALNWDLSGASEHTALDAGDLVLRQGGILSVRVQDEQGRPLAGVRVAVVEAEALFYADRLPCHVLATDEEGRCAFLHLSRNTHHVQAQCPGYQETRTSEYVPGSGADELLLVLERGTTLSGLVMESDGTPAAGVAVRIRTQDDGAFSMLAGMFDLAGETLSTGADGSFRHDGARADGRYFVRAERSAIQWVERGDVQPGEDLVLRLPPAAILSGRLLLAGGEPAAGARLAARSEDAHGSWFDRDSAIEAEDDGSFQMELRTGRYRLAAWHPRGEGLVARDLEVRGTTEAGVLLLPSAGALEVSLITADGKPAREARLEEDFSAMFEFPSIAGEDPAALEQRLELHRRRQEELELRMYLSHGRERPQEIAPGVLRWPGLAPGVHQLVVEAEGAPPTRFQAEIAPDQVTTVNIQLGAEATLALTVRNSDGSPANGVVLGLLPPAGRSGGWHWMDRHEPVHNGSAQFDRLTPGTYLLREGYGLDETVTPLAILDLNAGRNEAVVTLEPRYTLLVSVTDSTGPVTGALVTVWTANGERAHRRGGETDAGELETDGAGVVEVPGLHPGRYRVSAARPGGMAQSIATQVESNRQAVAIRLEGFTIEGHVENAPETCSVELLRVPVREEAAAPRPAGRAPALVDGHTPRGALAHASCDARGGFRFVDLQPGQYSLRAQAPGYYQEAPVNLELRDASAGDVVLTLREEGRLVVRVSGLDEDRRGGGFFIEAASVHAQWRSMTWAHSDGDHQLHGLPPGQYRVAIRRQRAPDGELLAEFTVNLSAVVPTIIDWDASTAR